jgi:predicted ArsR family transcriptional regulator
MTTARQKILAYLKKTRSASSREIGRAMDMTPANARRHLSILQKDGRVTVSGQRRQGRGRPGRLYSLSAALEGDNLPELLEATLDSWLTSLEPLQRAAALRSLGQRMSASMPQRESSLPKRLAAVTEHLNTRHYAAHWEAGAEGPRVILGRCPYASVIGRHPELCQADAAMLASSLGASVEQRNKLQPACVFIVTP